MKQENGSHIKLCDKKPITRKTPALCLRCPARFVASLKYDFKCLKCQEEQKKKCTYPRLLGHTSSLKCICTDAHAPDRIIKRVWLLKHNTSYLHSFCHSLSHGGRRMKRQSCREAKTVQLRLKGDRTCICVADLSRRICFYPAAKQREN